MNSNRHSIAPPILKPHYTSAPLGEADIVIIGNGIAGLTAAIEARHHDPDKRIVVMTDQLHPTINTPALKQFTVNKLKRDQLLAYPPGIEQSQNIHIINARVQEIHADSKYLALNGNRAFGYKKLLIATGSQPTGLPADIPGQNLDGVMTLHRLKDYLDLRRRLPEVREAVVIGGGTHANETVMSLLHWGIRVHWLIRGRQFLSRTLDQTASELVLSNVRRAGAIIHTETEVRAIFGRLATVVGVLTNTDELIPCQLVLCCTGTSPAQGLAAQSTEPILFKNGILVDSRLRTSVQDIYAAGDVAALPNLQTGGYETRAEWYSAVTQGKIAGAMMVGRTEIATELFGAHWHGTQLGDLSMLTVGDPLSASTNEQIDIYTDQSGSGYRRLLAIGDRLVGYLSVGTTRPDGLSIKRLIDEGLPIRNILKPLLKGKFDAHRYLTKVKASTRKLETQPLPTLQQLAALQWPERRYLNTSPSIQIPSATRQTDAINLNMLIQQTIREDTSYEPKQAYLNVETGSLRQATKTQFMKPGIIDNRYRKRESVWANVSAT